MEGGVFVLFIIYHEIFEQLTYSYDFMVNNAAVGSQSTVLSLIKLFYVIVTN